jgi:signal transduction histidine kinase
LPRRSAPLVGWVWPDVRRLTDRRAVVHLCLVAAACALLGATAFVLARGESGAIGDARRMWVEHAAAGLLGILSVAPLVFWADRVPSVRRRAGGELAAAAGLVVVATHLGFDPRPVHGLIFPYVPLAVVLLAVVRLGRAGAALLPPLLAALSLWHTGLGHGPWAQITAWPLGRVVAAQAYALVAVTTAWLIASILEERDVADEQLETTNQRLEAEVSTRTAELVAQADRARISASASHTFSEAQFDETQLLHAISRELADVLGDVCSVRHLGDDGALVVAAVHGRDEAFAGELADATRAFALGTPADDLIARAVATGTVVRVTGGPDQVNAAFDPVCREFVADRGIHSVMIAPMRARGTTVGSICVVRAHTREEFTQADGLLLQDLADRAGLAVANARLLAQVADATRRAEAAAAVSHALSQARMDKADAMNVVCRATADALGDACMVLQLSDDEATLSPCAVFAADPSLEQAIRDTYFPLVFSTATDGLTGRALATGRSVRVGGDVGLFAEVAHPATRDAILAQGLHSGLVAPMHADQDVVGALVVLRGRTPGQFTDRDVEFIQDLADRAGLALANAVLHTEVADQASENQRLYAAERDARMALRDSEQRRREVLSTLLEAEEAERTRIATALHDDTVQVLAASLMALDGLPAAVTGGSADKAATTARRARETLAEATERTRRLMFELRPTVLHDYGIVAATRVLLDQTGRETGAVTHLTGEAGRYHLVLEEAMYRAVQEALANIRNHSQATEVSVTFDEHAGMSICEVIDNGRGFDPQEALRRPDAALHIGLSHIVERVRAAGGNVLVASARGEGTHVRITIPIERRRTDRSQRQP